MAHESDSRWLRAEAEIEEDLANFVECHRCGAVAGWGRPNCNPVCVLAREFRLRRHETIAHRYNQITEDEASARADGGDDV